MNISSLCRNGMQTGNSAVYKSVPPLPRLLYIASPKSQGGIEHHSVALAAALAERGASVQFACTSGSYVETWCREAGLPTTTLRVRNSGDFGAAWRLAKLIQKESIGLVHAHSRRDYVVAVLGVALARRVLRCRTALVLHAHMVRPLGGPAKLNGRFFEWGADAVVAVSGAVCDTLRHEHGFNPTFVHHIPNGVSLTRFALPHSCEAARRRSQIRRSLGVPENARVLGMIGRLDAKGQHQLLGIVPELLRFCPSLRIVFAGSEGKTGERAALAALAEDGGFQDRLILTGPRTDIPDLLTAFDALVHLPTDEAFGLALAEGMAAGLPTVATAIGGCREVVQDGVTGLLVPPGDPAALVSALRRLLDPVQGASLRQALGDCGRQSVQKNFSQDIQLQRLEALYLELCPAVSR